MRRSSLLRARLTIRSRRRQSAHLSTPQAASAPTNVGGYAKTSLLLFAGVVGLAIWAAIEHQARRTAAQVHQALEEPLAQMAGLIARNEQLSNLLARAVPRQPPPDEQFRELLRLRGELSLLRQQARELPAVREENRQARAALGGNQGAGAAKSAATSDYWPRDAWVFSGFASPDAALQTSLWAANNGDLKALAASATGEVQKQIEEDLRDKSDTEASIRAMDEVMALKSVRILNREVQGDDSVVLTAAFEAGTETQTNKLVVKKIGNEWKVSGRGE